jgi:hypothetical protein
LLRLELQDVYGIGTRMFGSSVSRISSGRGFIQRNMLCAETEGAPASGRTKKKTIRRRQLLSGFAAFALDWAISGHVLRPIQFFHMPVPKRRTDDAYFAPLDNLSLPPETELYLGLVHYDDPEGDAARISAARRHARIDGVAPECGMARGDPARLPALLDGHVRAAQAAARG